MSNKSNGPSALYASVSTTSSTHAVGVVARVTYWRRDAKGVGRIERKIENTFPTQADADAMIAAWLEGPDGYLFNA